MILKVRVCFFQPLTSEASQLVNVVTHISSYSQGLFHFQISFTGGEQEAMRRMRLKGNPRQWERVKCAHKYILHSPI